MNKIELITHIFEITKNGNEAYPLLSSGFGGDKTITLLTIQNIVLNEKDSYSEQEVSAILKKIDSGWQLD
jgi:hypothetical protein